MDAIERRGATRSEHSSEFSRRLAAARGGSAKSLGDLFDLLRQYLMIVAEREIDDRLRVKIDAYDAVQLTFMQAQRALDDFTGNTEQEWRGWLRQILLNEIAQAARHYRAAKCEIGREVALPEGGSSDGGWQLASPEQTPSKGAVANENQLRLAQALERLPVDQRRVIELRNTWMSFEQIGLATDRPAAAAQKLWSRAVERLREMLAE